MNVLLLLILGAIAQGSETKIHFADFKPLKKNAMFEVFEAPQIELKPGTSLKIELPLNMGTGYQWELLGPDHGPLGFVHLKNLPPASPRPGALTYQQYEFKAKPQPKGSSSQIVLVFNSRRSFEGVGNTFYQVRIIVGNP